MDAYLTSLYPVEPPLSKSQISQRVSSLPLPTLHPFLGSSASCTSLSLLASPGLAGRPGAYGFLQLSLSDAGELLSEPVPWGDSACRGHGLAAASAPSAANPLHHSLTTRLLACPKMGRISMQGTASRALVQPDPLQRPNHYTVYLPSRLHALDGPGLQVNNNAQNVLFTAVSDLHLERRGGAHPPLEQLFSSEVEAQADVLALLGDIGDPSSESYQAFVRACAARFPLVLVVPGNHEYHNDDGASQKEIRKVLSTFLATLPNVVLMHNAAVTLRLPTSSGGGLVRVLGTTLWSFVPDEPTASASGQTVNKRAYIANTMHDYKHVFIEPGRLITPEKVCQLHLENVAWLQQELSMAAAEGMRCAVLSHHVPTMQGTSHPRFADSPTGNTYSTPLEHLMGDAFAPPPGIPSQRLRPMSTSGTAQHASSSMLVRHHSSSAIASASAQVPHGNKQLGTPASGMEHAMPSSSGSTHGGPVCISRASCDSDSSDSSSSSSSGRGESACMEDAAAATSALVRARTSSGMLRAPLSPALPSPLQPQALLPQPAGAPGEAGTAEQHAKQPAFLPLWMCGHTHYNFDLDIKGTRVVSNQWGYGDDPERSYRRDFLVPLTAAPLP